jgi:translation initiation factor 1A
MMEEEIRVRIARQGEILGVVDAMLGSNKMRVRCQDEKVRICRIPGKLRKRIWIKEGDAVLVKPWSIQGERSGDIVWKYNPTEAAWLRRRNILLLE